MRGYRYILISAGLSFLMSCGGNNPNNSTTTNNINNNNVQNIEKHFSLEIKDLNPESDGKISDKYELKISKEDKHKIDSAVLKIDNKKIAVLNGEDSIYTIDTKDFRCGIIPITIEINYEGKKEYVANSIKLVSDIVPKRKTYKVIKTFNHDVNAYCQGLIYENGILYESTGLNRKSSIREVKLENGSVIKSYSLEDQYFGEGLTSIDDKLIQLTWRSHKGFVYDKKTFQKISDFEISTEGWGLTNVGDTLLLTDGTENLYYLDGNNFSQIKNIQVYDNLGPVKLLNESEIIKGHLYANIYQSDLIAEIDYHTGKVLSYIDLTGILPSNLIDDETDVLNGIAYDSQGDRIFVTGKNWARLFQIKIIE